MFDEQGTPTFRNDRETDWFLGVAVTYDLEDEEELFNTCSELLGLLNKRPLKNAKIHKERANGIAQLIANLPIQIVVSSLNLSNSDLQRVITLYEELGSLLRKRHRHVRGRPIAQILHSHILDECIFKSITNYMDINQISSKFSIYIDDWSIPTNDMEIYLNGRSGSINNKMNSLYKRYGSDFRIDISPISLLKEDSLRKRFIDEITSSVSRSFLKSENERYSEVPINSILANEINQYEEITDKEIEFVNFFMNINLKNPPVNYVAG